MCGGLGGHLHASSVTTLEKASAAGVNRLFLILSFDCDAPEDIEASAVMYERLRAIGVQPEFAVPGELLLRGRTAYRSIAGAGCEFLNHGGSDA